MGSPPSTFRGPKNLLVRRGYVQEYNTFTKTLGDKIVSIFIFKNLNFYLLHQKAMNN